MKSKFIALAVSIDQSDYQQAFVSSVADSYSGEIHKCGCSPFRAFRAVPDETDKVLVPHFADGFNLHLEFLLGLTPKNKSSSQSTSMPTSNAIVIRT